MTRILFLLVLGVVAASARAAWQSGEQIPVGTRDGVGPLAPHAVISVPLGAVALSGSESLDIVVGTTKYGTEPGIWLYQNVGDEAGTPIFKKRYRITHPFKDPYPPAGCVVQRRDGAVAGLWLSEGALVFTRFDAEFKAFVEPRPLSITGLPRGAGSVGATELPDGTWLVYLGVGDGTPYITSKADTRNADYMPYDGAGMWHGELPYCALYAVSVSADGTAQLGAPKRASLRDRDVRMGMNQIVPLPGNDPGSTAVITGSCFGELHYFESDSPMGIWEPRRMAVGKDRIALRHPTIYPRPMAYPGKSERGSTTDLLVGGEGGIYYYRNTGGFAEGGQPIFDDPVYALEMDAKLYGGTLPVTNVVDWDGDGDLDLVAGNSEGLVQFFQNTGNNESPAMLPGVPLHAGDEMIHVQPGYRLDIQGPGEARWGYTCPTVIDWNGDGLLDILMSDSTARHHVYLNVGTAKAPKLAPAHALYYEGLDLYGTWRVQPAVGKLDGRMAYITLDEDDEFHLYWQVDAYNLLDGGKLSLDTGEPILANFLKAGGTGRLKLSLVDWDRDGAQDILVGTPRHGSVPDPKSGLPKSLGLPGSAVLLLRNTGTDAAPKFAFPKLMAFKGQPIFLGQHACSPAVAPFRGMDHADLIVAEEEGRFRFYKREDLSLFDAKDYVRPEAAPK